MNNLNEALECYQNEYHNVFSNMEFNQLITKFKEKMDIYYKKRVENFDSYEDHIKELNMMLDGNENNESNNTVNLMIENLLIEKKKIEYDLLMEYENEVQEFIQIESQNNILKGNEYIEKMKTQLKLKLQELVMNHEVKSNN